MNKTDLSDTLSNIARQLNLLAKIDSIYINDDDAQAMAEQLIEFGDKLNFAAKVVKSD